jgi:uncharacterized membrane protein
MPMEKSAAVARVFVAIGMAAFGVHQLAYGTFARWVAKVPAWLPAPAIWPYVTGMVFLVCAPAILFGKQARAAALIVSAMILTIAVVLHPFEIASNPGAADLWGRAAKVFALSGAAALVARSLPGERVSSLEWLIPLGPFFLGAFFCIAGVEHFIYAPFVERLVPAWIPARMFWTYFAGVALLAGGLGMMVPKTARLAGIWSGIMVFSWVLLLHIPRALANLTTPPKQPPFSKLSPSAARRFSSLLTLRTWLPGPLSKWPGLARHCSEETLTCNTF